MKITASPDVDRVKPEELARYTSIFLSQVVEKFNKNLNFTDDFSGNIINVTFSSANVDVASIHGLGRVPSGYIILGASAAMSVYDGASANTSSLIYLRSSAAGVAKVLVV